MAGAFAGDRGLQTAPQSIVQMHLSRGAFSADYIVVGRLTAAVRFLRLAYQTVWNFGGRRGREPGTALAFASLARTGMESYLSASRQDRHLAHIVNIAHIVNRAAV